MRILLVAIQIFLSLSLSSQSHTEFYQGIITQELGQAKPKIFAYWLELNFSSNSFYGKSRIEVPDSEKYGILGVKGTSKNDKLEFESYAIIEENIRKFGRIWCNIKASLEYSDTLGILFGDWSGSKECGSGQIFMVKTNLPFNDSSSQQNYYTSIEKVEESIKTENLTVPVKILVENISFESNQYSLNDESKQVLDDIVKVLHLDNTHRIKIIGHSDNIGDHEFNFVLSLRRAESVLEYLKSNNFSSNRLFCEGLGESKPIGDNNSEIGRAKNRRIEIEIF